MANNFNIRIYIYSNVQKQFGGLDLSPNSIFGAWLLLSIRWYVDLHIGRITLDNLEVSFLMFIVGGRSQPTMKIEK